MLRTEKKKKEGEHKLTLAEINNLFLVRKACLKNILDLIEESYILYKHRKYSRTFALAYTAFKEISKFIVVSDFITGIVSKTEFLSCFRQHDIKASYGRIKVLVDNSIEEKNTFSNDATLKYDLNEGKKIFANRNNSLYVDIMNNYVPIEPKKNYKAKQAKEMINVVKKRIMRVVNAELFNSRIGTKALIK